MPLWPTYDYDYEEIKMSCRFKRSVCKNAGVFYLRRNPGGWLFGWPASLPCVRWGYNNVLPGPLWGQRAQRVWAARAIWVGARHWESSSLRCPSFSAEGGRTAHGYWVSTEVFLTLYCSLVWRSVGLFITWHGYLVIELIKVSLVESIHVDTIESSFENGGGCLWKELERTIKALKTEPTDNCKRQIQSFVSCD